MKFDNKKDQAEIIQLLMNDLMAAEEEDGIGMYTDSEWFYDEVREKIKAWSEEAGVLKEGSES